MSRSFERLDYALGVINTPEDILVCPTGHKYEVVGLAVTGNLSVSWTWYFWVHSGADYHGLDQIAMPATDVFKAVSYQGWPIYAGEALAGDASPAAGPGGLVVSVAYIDVDYTD